MRSLVVATRNRGKMAEFERLLAAHGWRALALDETGYRGELEEPGVTYAENALAKASSVTDATGLLALGDDSGIEMIALDGWPGPISARWMGPEATDDQRLRGLLDQVDGRAGGDRRVRYVAALALTGPGREPIVVQGTCEGSLVEPRGSGGFGYDPGFLSHDLGVTFAMAPASDKARVSHRARALRALVRSGALTPTGPPSAETRWAGGA